MSIEWWFVDSLVEAYVEHERRTRGLREPTLRSYERLVRRFASAALGEDPIDPACLSCADVVEFVDLLGHRALDSAAIYAKLDLAALREVALPWPEAPR